MPDHDAPNLQEADRRQKSSDAAKEADDREKAALEKAERAKVAMEAAERQRAVEVG